MCLRASKSVEDPKTVAPRIRKAGVESSNPPIGFCISLFADAT
jgi:hypothetical protein